ncbi:MAG TPA: UDP-N-acetylmuramoyl-L-alanine--D-glutamate ligase [Candidatus Eisenbacteria bacterium]|nr:UDP-N-acetylmuramoyl-L-alanine--D-glutamate ligase [Candidatus Eisenbacteria bacterium]
MNPAGKKITVVGLGRSGFAAARFLAERGASVRATDASEKKEVLENAGYLRSAGAAVETGRHTEGFVLGSDLVVTSPGVPKESLPLALARKKGIPVISEIELASYFCRGRVIGVTGSNGKTTTCHLIHRMLAASGKKSVLCGNVGYSFLDAIAEIDARTTVVLELSSFQLEDSPAFRPHVAVVLNISPNHLDRHGSLARYVAAKSRIFANQRSSDRVVLNHDDAVVRRMARRARARPLFFSKKPMRAGVFPKGDLVVLKEGRAEKTLFGRSALLLEGSHNLENAMAAAAAASLAGARPEAIARALASFRTLEHRIEPLGEIAGVRFVNDSKSTTIDSTRAALASVPGTVVLVAGGRDKGAPFARLESLVAKKARSVVLYGEARGKIASSWKRYRRCRLEPDFTRAVKLAFESASPGDTVLLSPMCTSFDQFTSYEHRGETFKRVFEELRGGTGRRGA